MLIPAGSEPSHVQTSLLGRNCFIKHSYFFLNILPNKAG